MMPNFMLYYSVRNKTSVELSKTHSKDIQSHVARASWLLFLFFMKVPQIVIKEKSVTVTNGAWEMGYSYVEEGN